MMGDKDQLSHGDDEGPIHLRDKTALVSRWVPPNVYGSAARVYRLFRHIAPDDYCIITCSNMENGEGCVTGVRLPCTYHILPSEWRTLKIPANRLLKSCVAWLNVWLKVLQRARNVAKLLRHEKCRVAVSFTGELEDIPAAYLAARMTGCRFYPIVDDDYLTQWGESHKKWFARQVAPFIMRHSDGIFVISEYLGELYKQRYGRDYRVLHTATLDRVGKPPETVEMPRKNGAYTLLFTGSVYSLNIDVFPTILKGIGLLSGVPVKLHLYCWQTERQLSEAGINGPVVFHGSVGPEAVRQVQRDADILLVAFGFNTPYPEVCRTSFPTKVADYLISGRPIFVIAPADSYMARYFRAHRCGHVVDQNDPALIAEGLQRLTTDAAYRAELVRNAYEAAREDCEYPHVVQGFSDGIHCAT
jgi:glycosyltransferase involved in cell wall biosynthesis